MDAFLFTEIDDLLLWEKWVVFDLVNGGDDGGLGEQLLQVLHGVVGYTNGLDLLRMGLDELLEVFPCLDMVCAVVDVTGAIRKLREERMVS